MNDVELVVQIEDRQRMSARCDREWLIDLRSGIPAEFDSVVPYLHLAYGHSFNRLSSDLNCGDADRLSRSWRNDLHPIRWPSYGIGHRRLMQNAVVVVQIEDRQRMSARCDREWLIDLRSGIPAEFDAVVPYLRLVYGYWLRRLSDNLNRGGVV